MDFVYFLGRFHVLALHLPIGIILVVAVLEWLARKEKYRALGAAANFLWAAAAITAIGTAALGYMHFAEGGFDSATGALHRFFGTSVAVVTALIWLAPKAARPVASLVLVGLVVLTGHYGGNLTHGSTYLVEYAPGRHKVATTLEEADAYRDLIQPIFTQRCVGCHNDDKRRGGLSLASYATLMKGGEKGVVIVRAQADKSELVRRITLPAGEKEAMPAEGKPPLSPQQIAVIKWWIQSGAPTDTPLAKLTMPDEARQAASALLGFAKAESPQVATAADPKLFDSLVQAGFIVRQQSQSDPMLRVSKASPTPLTSAQVEALVSARSAIAELSLPRSGVSDEQLRSLAKLTSLKRLNLSGNGITDAGVAQLTTLKALTALNLYGNAGITDKAMSVVTDLHDLEALYVWGTAVTPARATQLHATRPKLAINLGSDLP